MKDGILAFMLLLLMFISLGAWLYLIFLRGFFWKCDLRRSDHEGEFEHWPAVIAVVPARNEAPLIEQTLVSLRRQDYPGEFSIVLVDDNSDDSTAELARRAAEGDGHALHVITGVVLPPGWTGKLWAMSQGVRHADLIQPRAEYLWFTDADLRHRPPTLRGLVRLAAGKHLDLASNMALLHCASLSEQLLIPAFVFFFRKLYPFRHVNIHAHPAAAAAGGSMLVSREALRQSGGLEAIRGELIDDCALARLIKARGPIRLELTRDSVSIRPYDLADIWRMVARSAYTQLKYSPLRLLLTAVGMILIYLAPPVGLAIGILTGQILLAEAGAAAWALMTLAYWPTVRLYRQHGLMATLLPIAATLYTLMTIDSARRHWQGNGGQWKGRVHVS